MRDLNKVILIGRLGADPILRETRSGTHVTNFPVATSRRMRTDAAGEGGPGELEETVWHRVVVWSRQAQHCAQYLKKGSPIYVEGSIRTRRYQDKEGLQRMAFEVHADNIGFLGNVPRGVDEEQKNGDEWVGQEPGVPEPMAADEAILERSLPGAIG